MAIYLCFSKLTNDDRCMIIGQFANSLMRFVRYVKQNSNTKKYGSPSNEIKIKIELPLLNETNEKKQNHFFNLVKRINLPGAHKKLPALDSYTIYNAGKQKQN